MTIVLKDAMVSSDLPAKTVNTARRVPATPNPGIQTVIVRRRKILKADPYHDELGRFTSGEDSGSNTHPLLPSWQDLQSATKISGPVGSNGGQWFKGDSGTEYFMKPLDDNRHGMNEIASQAVYRAAGLQEAVDIPRTGVTHDPEGHAFLVSEKIEGLKQIASGEDYPAKTQGLARQHFGADALLSHWDTAGLENDNTFVDKHGNPVRIETGGAMAYRAQGSPKNEFGVGKPWSEPDTMRNGAQGQRLYGKMDDVTAARSLAKLTNLDLGKVEQDWQNMGIPKAVYQPWLDTLGERIGMLPTKIRDTLLGKFHGS